MEAQSSSLEDGGGGRRGVGDNERWPRGVVASSSALFAASFIPTATYFQSPPIIAEGEAIEGLCGPVCVL